MNTRSEQPNFDTATETTSDLLKVEWVRKSRSAATLRFLVDADTYTLWGYSEYLFISKKDKSTVNAGNRRNSFLARVRCVVQLAVVSTCARRFL